MDFPTHAVLVEASDAADGLAAGFGALLEARSLAMLPVGGKPLVQHWLERLSESGCANVLLLIENFPEAVRELIGNGERWGLNVTISSLREGSNYADATDAARGFVEGQTLFAAIHFLPQDGLATWVTGTEGAHCGWHGSVLPLGVIAADTWQDDSTVITPTPTCGRLIEDTRGLWQANMDILDGTLTDPNPPGFEQQPGLHVGRHTRIPSTTQIETPCLIGDETLLGKRIQLGPRALIGSHVIIDDASTLRDCVVLDDTFIGSHAELTQCIVDRRLVVRVDSGVAAYIDDPLILDDLRHSGSNSVPLAHRLLALLLLILLTIPLLLAVLLRTLSGGSPWKRETLMIPEGKDLLGEPRLREHTPRSLAVNHPMWRKAPWLWSVARGKLPLFGVNLHDERRNALPEWARDLRFAAPGAITLADVTGASRDGEECENALVTDSYYLATRNTGTHASLLGRWLLGLLRKSS